VNECIRNPLFRLLRLSASKNRQRLGYLAPFGPNQVQQLFWRARVLMIFDLDNYLKLEAGFTLVI